MVNDVIDYFYSCVFGENEDVILEFSHFTEYVNHFSEKFNTKFTCKRKRDIDNLSTWIMYFDNNQIKIIVTHEYEILVEDYFDIKDFKYGK